MTINNRSSKHENKEMV